MNNPISTLFELCLSKNVPVPEFKQLSISGEDHLPNFLFEIKIDAWNLKAEANGPSKKKAKHAAAELLLEKININQNLDYSNALLPVHTPKSFRPVDKIAQKINAIGKLQEICTHKNWFSPQYVELPPDGPPHCPKFTVACHVGKIIHYGSASTVKQAKHESAYKMFEHVKDLKDLSAKEMNECFNSDISNSKPMIKAPDVKQMIEHNPEVFNDIDIIHDEINNQNAANMLVEILNAKKINISFITSSKPGPNGLFPCLLSLEGESSYVFFGKGKDDLEAKNDAAHSAILDLKYLNFD